MRKCAVSIAVLGFLVSPIAMAEDAATESNPNNWPQECTQGKYDQYPYACTVANYQVMTSSGWEDRSFTAYCTDDGTKEVYQSGSYTQNGWGETWDIPQYSCRPYEPIECEEPDYLDPDSGQCITPPQEPEECLEQGKYYDRSQPQGQECVTECAHGNLDHYCNQDPLPEDPEEPQCGPGHPDYKGIIGYGGEAALVCGEAEDQCPTGSSYGFTEQSDGSKKATCFPPESNPPQCPGGSAVIKGEGGISFQCGEIRNPDATPDDLNDAMDGDSDGDGQGDITGITNQLGKVQELLKKGNNTTNNINETLKGLGQSVKDGTSAITDAIGDIPGGGGGSGGDGSGEGEGETEEPVTWSGEPIDTDLTDPTEQYDQVMADYQAKINEIKGEVQAMFSTNLTGGGSVDDNTKTIMGVDVNFSLNRFLSGLDILGAIVLFCAAFISAGILFSGRG